MELFDKLTDEDKQCIIDYITENTNIVSIPDLSRTLGYWSKSKRTLYKVLGKQLRLKIPMDYEISISELTTKINEVYIPVSFVQIFSYSYEQYTQLVLGRKNNYLYRSIYNKYQHPLLIELVNWYWTLYLANEEEDALNYLQRSYTIIDKLLHPNRIAQKTIDPWLHNYYEVNKDLTISSANRKPLPKSIKPMRLLRKMLVAIRFPHMELFEDFNAKISTITTGRVIHGNLVFSIHPIDFMTLSDNNAGWSSCMSWDSGSYSNGTLEMMNSNIALVAYLEASNKFEVKGHDIPNKQWRCLYYMNKDIICTGKSYPYTDYSFSRKVLDILAGIAKKNMKWDYQFKNQRYFDILNFCDNTAIRCDYNPDSDTQKGFKRIVLYNYTAMYNDLVEDRDYEYYCYRNPPKRSYKLCMSGPATCLVCGKPIDSVERMRLEHDECSIARGMLKFCMDCENKFGSEGRIYPTAKFVVLPHMSIYESATRAQFWGSKNTPYDFSSITMSYRHPIEVALGKWHAYRYIGDNEKYKELIKLKTIDTPDDIFFVLKRVDTDFNYNAAFPADQFQEIPITQELLEGYIK